MQWTKAGEFNRPITVQKIDGYTINANGDQIEKWADLFTGIMAKVAIQSGGEFWASRKVNAEWTGLFKIRYSVGRSEIDQKMRLIYRKRTFNITNAIDPEEAHRELWIEAKEVN